MIEFEYENKPMNSKDLKNEVIKKDNKADYIVVIITLVFGTLIFLLNIL